MGKLSSRDARIRRHRRVRASVNGTTERPRLCVFRSLNHIYAQVIDDSIGSTLASASTVIETLKSKADGINKVAQAKLVGTQIAEEAIGKGIKQVVFDRGGYQYHGRIKALADAAREAGLKF
jgi:large subunit ribosomal protein L18